MPWCQGRQDEQDYGPAEGDLGRVLGGGDIRSQVGELGARSCPLLALAGFSS